VAVAVVDINQIAVDADLLIDCAAAQCASDAVAGRDEVHIGAVAFDIAAGDGEIAGRPVVEAVGLADTDGFEHFITRHRPPAKSKVDGGNAGEAVEAVGLVAKDAGFDLESGFGDELVITDGKGCSVEGLLDWGLLNGECGVEVGGGVDGLTEFAGKLG